jgi:phosphatidate cytidylyltransferase
MLRQRVITAVVLLVLLGAVLGSGSEIAFRLTLAIFFGAACWEALKLSGVRMPLPMALMSAALLLPMISRATTEWIPLASVSMVLWLLRFFPALRFGLPTNTGLRGALFNSLYLIALLGCFISMAGLWQRSAVFLFSAMAIVWVADIGAYFAGRAFGKRKLAPNWLRSGRLPDAASTGAYRHRAASFASHRTRFTILAGLSHYSLSFLCCGCLGRFAFARCT